MKKKIEKELTVKDIRIRSGLTRQEFCEKYDIKMGTLKQWESRPDVTYHRECPKYLINLFDRAERLNL